MSAGTEERRVAPAARTWVHRGDGAAMLLVTASLFFVPLVRRVGGTLSISDLVLFGAFWVAVVLGPRPWSRPLRALLWLTALFQVSTAFTVLANPYSANVVEWAHEWELVAGALVVGWAVGASGHVRGGFAVLLAPCLAIAVLAISTSLSQLSAGNLGPVYLSWPFGMHKNVVGDVLAFAGTVLYARPAWLRWPRRVTWPLFAVVALGAVASQSRQGLAGLAVALMIVIVRRYPTNKRSKLPLLTLVPAAVWWIVSSTQAQVDSGNTFNSAYTRLHWYAAALDVWRSDVPFGAGLRWWYTDRFPLAIQPPNAELEVLSSTGVVGLLGFTVLCVGALVVLWRTNPLYGTLAVAVVANRLVQGQLDIFWVTVQTSIPFVVAGLCLGHQSFVDGGGEPALEGVVT